MIIIITTIISIIIVSIITQLPTVLIYAGTSLSVVRHVPLDHCNLPDI